MSLSWWQRGRRVAVVVVLASAALGCGPSEPAIGGHQAFPWRPPLPDPAAGSEEGEREPYRPIPWTGDVHPDGAQMWEERQRIRKLVEAEDFAGLEAMGEQARRPGGVYLGGESTLFRFYSGVEQITDPESRERVTENVRFLEAWLRRHPDSKAARTLMARLWTYRAWREPDSSRPKLNGRTLPSAALLKRAQAVFEEASRRGLADVAMYDVGLDIARGLGSPLPERRELIAEVMAREPLMVKAYRGYVLSLFPRWYGRPEDVVGFCEEVYSRVGGTEGEILYGRLAHYALEEAGGEEFVRQYRFDRERILRGYAAAMAKYPLSNTINEEFLGFARAYRDEGMMDQLLRHVAAQAYVNLEGSGRWELWIEGDRRLDRLLHRAVRRGDAPLAVVFMRMGADPNWADEADKTALSYAIELGDRHLVDVLEMGGAERSKTDQLAWAARSGDSEGVEELLAEGAEVSRNAGSVMPLDQAVRSRNHAVVKTLLEAGADPNASADGKYTAGSIAADIGDVESLILLLAHGMEIDRADPLGRRPLAYAARRNHVEAVRFLVEGGADPNREDLLPNNYHVRPLSEAIMSKGWESVEVLLEHGAEVNPKSEASPPLYVAAAFGNTRAVGLLLEHGADPRGVYERWLKTPLHAAADHNLIEIMEMLLRDPRTEVHARDRQQQFTALHLAVNNGHVEAARLLLRHGADPKLKDRRGRTALDLARLRGQEEMVALLEEAGG